jgi:Spy/CpxP family protein refolding chaperone
MKRVYLILVLVVAMMAGSAVTFAQTKTADKGQWLDQVRQYKRSYFIKELNLTKDQQQKFFALYDEMENQTTRLEEDTRAMERRITQAGDASDVEYEKAAEAMFDLKLKQAEIEKGYMEKFSAVLSAKQLFELKVAERQFARDMVRQHNKLRNSAKRTTEGKQ